MKKAVSLFRQDGTSQLQKRVFLEPPGPEQDRTKEESAWT
jgi:hypothetical protein